MKFYFIQEAVYYKYKGVIYSDRISYDVYWDRYLEFFDFINVIARVKEVEKLEGNFHVAEGDKVNFIPLPFYNGVLGYLISRKKIREIFKTHLTNKGIYVLRIPGSLGFSFSNLLVKNNIKYIAEVVGDPYEVIKNLKIWKPLRYLMMRKSKFQMKKSVFNASGVLYVTKYQLQNKYPKSKSAFTAAASNVIIKDENVVLRDKVKVLTSLKERLCNKSLEPIRIGVLGMLYPIKSPLEIVEAVDLLIKEGINIELIFAGDGPLKKQIIQMAEIKSIDRQVRCLGKITNVNEFLDNIDLYVQFSKTEGIPRALLEAMSRGCLTVSSDVGGITELLPKSFLISSINPHELYLKIKEVLLDEELILSNLDNNYIIAKQNTVSELKKIRSEFYKQVYNLYNKNI